MGDEFFKDALTMSDCVRCRRIGSVWRKSPPKTTTLPPKGIFGDSMRCRKVLSTASNTFLWSIGLSSQNIADALIMARPKMHLLVRKHVVLSVMEIGMLNAECAVCP